MNTSSYRMATRRVPVIQLFNDRLANAVNAQRRGKQAYLTPGLPALRELFEQLDEDIDDYIDIVAEQPYRPGSITLSTKRFVTTWSHYLRTRQMARSRVIMALASFPNSPRFAN